MAGAITLPLFREMVPGGFSYGGNYLVEFEPASPWYEASLTIALHALSHGIRTEYHTFRHMPGEIRTALQRMGLDIAKVENEGLFRILDTYRLTTGLDAAETTGAPAHFQARSFDVGKWGSSILDMIKGGVPESEKRWLHLDDDTSVLSQYTDENTFIDTWRTKGIPYARARELVQFPSLLKGAASEAVFAKFESFADGIIDFKSLEEKGEIKHYVRVRAIRGQACDTHWKLLSIHDNGEVGLGQLPANERTPLLAGSSEGTRKLAAIMFTDMVGYTALGQRDESLSLALVDEQRKLIRPILNRHNGREVKTMGDAFLAEFPSALDAVRCAYDIQRATREFNISLPSDRRVHLRVGVHLGDIVASDGDISGDALNIASRIEPLAEDGGVCLTRQVYDQVQNKFELTLTSMGSRTLKNVSLPIEIYKMVMPWEEKKPTPARQLDKTRIAVLPFQNISPDPADEYFADGMTEEVISTMSRISGQRVIARTSVMGYKGGKKKISEVARELGVGTVLEGSVRKSGNRIRITVQLIDALSEEHVWVQDYDRELDNVFSIQSDIAKRIAKALKVRILQSESLRLEKKATQLPEAYSLYLKGRHSSSTRTEPGLRAAVGYFENAIKIDPSFALAYTGLAEAYSVLALLELYPPKEAFPKAKLAAEKALTLDDHLAEAHVSLGLVKFQFDWDWLGAEAEFKQALALNSGYAPAHQYYADYLKAMGRLNEALSEMEQAHSLDPLSLAINTGVGHVLYLSREYDKSIEQYRKTVELDQAFVPARLWFGRPYMQKGMYKEAIDQLDQAVQLSNGGTVSLAMLGQAYATAGQVTEAGKILQRLLDRSKKQYVPSYWISLVYMSMGNKDEAFAWLERAYNEKSSWLVWMNVEPRFDRLRDDPRYTSIVSRMRLETPPSGLR